LTYATRAAFLALMAAALLTTGCVAAWNDLDDAPWSPPSNLAEAVSVYDYDKAPISAHVEPTESRDNYDLIRISFPAYDQSDPANMEVVAWYYKQKKPGTHPGIIQVPILAGDYAVAIHFAEFFASRGYHVLRFERKEGLLDSARGLEQTRKVVLQSVIDIRRLIDWWETNPELDAGNIGICGVSNGGFQSSIVMAVDARIKAGAFLLNGGDFGEVITISKEGLVIEFRDELKKLKGWDDAELIRQASLQMDSVDPMAVAPLLNPQRVLHVPPRFDQVVPFEYAEKWYEAANRPSRVVIPTGHYSSALFIYYIRALCLEHFRLILG
jgi:fermentation-respiration switch protein FrsA (DUF1100 family)